MKSKLSLLVLSALCASALCGCSSTARRAAIITTAAGAGGGAGYLIGNKRPEGALIGAVATAGAAALALGEDGETYAKGLDDGYVLGSSDATKRLYWSKQALESKPSGGQGATRTSYYTFPGPQETSDGRKLVPNTVVVPVVEPVDPPQNSTSTQGK